MTLTGYHAKYFAYELTKRCSSGEDAVEQIEHLPEMTACEDFDKVDDSVFNDQNESEHA